MIESTYTLSNKFGGEIYFFLLFVTTNSRTFLIYENQANPRRADPEKFTFWTQILGNFYVAICEGPSFSLNVLGRWQKVKPKGAQGRIRGLLGLRQTLTNVRDFDLEKMIAYER